MEVICIPVVPTTGLIQQRTLQELVNSLNSPWGTVDLQRPCASHKKSQGSGKTNNFLSTKKHKKT